MTSSLTAWDDTRLEVAFAARAERVPPTPADLAVAVRARLATTPGRSPIGLRRAAPSLGLAAAVVVAVVVGIGQLGRTGPAASSTPGASSLAALVGSPVSVSRAIEIRDAGTNDREIAVTGFLARLTRLLGCDPDLQPQNPARLGCPAAFNWLLDAPEVVETTSGNTTTGHAPTGSSIQPSFALSVPDLDGGASAPPRLTLIGHFDDRRAALCDGAERAACGDTFVVDRIATVDDRAQPVTTVLRNTRYDKVSAALTLDPDTSEADADRLVQAAVPDVTILSRQLLTGDRVASVEPMLAGDAGWTGQRLVWIVTAVGIRDDISISRTWLIVDGTSQVVEMTANGPAAQPTPSASLPPSPTPSPADSEVATLLAHPITVAAAIDNRDTNLDDTEFAVEGFAWGPRAVFDCGFDMATPAAFRGCERSFTWLAATADTQPGPASLEPTGPAFNLFVQPETIGADIVTTTPSHVIALGHFDDHRADLCRPEQVDRCRKSFVVDALVDASDRRLDRSTDLNRIDPQVRPRMTNDQAIGAMGLDRAGPSIVAVFAVRPAALPELEPEIAHAPELQGADIVWIVRWIALDTAGRPILWTRITIDGDPGRLGGVESWDVMQDGLVSTLREPDAPRPQTAAPSVVASGSGPQPASATP